MTNLLLQALFRMQDELSDMIAEVVRGRQLSADSSAEQVTDLVHARDQLTTAAHHVLAAEFQGATKAIIDAAAQIDTYAKRLDDIVKAMKDEQSTADSIGSAIGMVGQAVGLVAAIA